MNSGLAFCNKNVNMMTEFKVTAHLQKNEFFPGMEEVNYLLQNLNEIGYIVPGLGDAGDRIFGTK